MKLTIAILTLGLAAVSAGAQNPDQIQYTRDTMHALQQKQTRDSNAALQSSDSQASAATSQVAAKQGISVARAAKNSKAKRHSKESVSVATTSNETEKQAEAPKNIRLTGRRDPFVSPVISQAAAGSGCSTGKKCLAVDQIALKGIVRSDSGMIAVVTNALEKAYFLRENDPVFNGYVVKITGDSVIFKETVRDRLGKPFEREVTKKITTPAV
jgi:ATPase subunit of ABC transporter with duplicated ATPase domains